jgi:hypothetical protein
MSHHATRRPLFAASLVVFAVAGLGASCASTTTVDSSEQADQGDDAISASDAIARAEEWVSVKLHYCQSANHARDYDAACSSTCERHSDPAWDPYRSDCSGLVSWAWKLPAPGRTTLQFAPYETDITKTIEATDLAPGDAINNSDHVMLFKKWVSGHTRATFIEEPGCSSSTPYAHEVTTDVSTNGTSIYVPYNGMTFTAIRYKSLSNAPPPPPPPPPLENDRIGVSSWASGRLDLFGRGTDNHLKHRWYDGSWHDWQDLGGKLTSSPAAVSWAENRIDVFAADTNNHLTHTWWDGDWHGFEDLGGDLTSAPSASSFDERSLDVFARDDHDHLVHKYFRDATGWSGWEDLGGDLASTPTAVSWASDRIDVFARDSSDRVTHIYFDAASHAWSNWSEMEGDISGGPGVTSWADGRLDLFGADPDHGHLMHRWYTGGAWSSSNWEDLGGELTSSPVGVSWADGRIDVFGRNGGHVVHKYFSSSGWSGWDDLESP